MAPGLKVALPTPAAALAEANSTQQAAR